MIALLCSSPSLWVNADYRLFTRRLSSVKSFVMKWRRRPTAIDGARKADYRRSARPAGCTHASAYSACTTDADCTVCIDRRHDAGDNGHSIGGLAWARPHLPLLTMQLWHPSKSIPAQASAARSPFLCQAMPLVTAAAAWHVFLPHPMSSAPAQAKAARWLAATLRCSGGHVLG